MTESVILKSLIKHLNIAVFHRQGNNQFRIIHKVPEWLNKIAPSFNRDETINLINLFPFLESFMDVAEKFWDNKSSEKSSSNIWIETDNNEKSYHLMASAFYCENENIIIIELADSSKDGNHVLIQKAREKSLAFEKISKAKNELDKTIEYKENYKQIISEEMENTIDQIMIQIQNISFDNTESYIAQNNQLIENLYNNVILLSEFNKELKSL